MLTSLFSLFYVTGEFFYRFLHLGRAKFSDLNFASYGLYNLPVLRHVSHTVSLALIPMVRCVVTF